MSKFALQNQTFYRKVEDTAQNARKIIPEILKHLPHQLHSSLLGSMSDGRSPKTTEKQYTIIK
jgi:hypothetical protein